MNRLEFFCFANILYEIFQTREEYGFLYDPLAEEGTVKNSMKQKTRIFC
jgi:hypothetical protein